MSLLAKDLPQSVKHRRFWISHASTADALATSEVAAANPGVTVAVAADSLAARQLRDDIRSFAPELPLYALPEWETLAYDLFSPHPHIVSRRIHTLYHLPGCTHGILIVTASALMQRLAPRQYITGSGLMLACGDTMELESEQQRLAAAGYRHVQQVMEPGEFAIRGALIDIFPMGSRTPYRVELFDADVDSIRSFDPETQRSVEQVKQVQLLPAREFPLTPEARAQFRETLIERFPIDVRHCPLYQDIKHGITPGGIEYYLPLFFDHTETLFDYLPDNALFMLDQHALDAAEHAWQQACSRHEQRAHDIERPILPPQELWLAPDTLRQQLNQQRRIEWVDANHAHGISLGSAPLPDISLPSRQAAAADKLATFVQSFSGRVLYVADTAGRREAIQDLLDTYGLKPVLSEGWVQFLHADSAAAISLAPFERGFMLPAAGVAVITEHELFGASAGRNRRRKPSRTARDPESIIRDLTALEEGSPIVHIDHGVGRYRGLETLHVGEQPGDFLVIEYAGGDKLYVPVAQLDRVSRYTGSSPENAPLHAMGGERWKKTRKKAAEKIHDVAAELLAIHAERAARSGHAIGIDRALYQQFAAGFPFTTTPDQEQAIHAVLADLEAPQAMDRVVCGDVGFGKTEVAMRAAFAVANAGKQVCILVPTTLLAQQHFASFSDRFADWPIKIASLSRFQSSKQSKQTLDELAQGKVDIVIGTHKLLSAQVTFKQLGLVIVDEEQRFGVRQKEKLKQLRAEVDLLTLTATPIPRTLNMAMSGMRDLSIIATAPEHRMAVQTTVARADDALLREAMERELARGGQVYFLHNKVDSIERRMREVQELMPQAKVRLAHGQMPERELEQVMLDFHRQRFNILVCTTIIESGIDIPSANTIIIDRADHFGLAQLHQLRGRVGRSNHRAYAYLLIPGRKAMTADARKRLDALASLEDLGAGFSLATHDLEIRGAGELLGDEQSGQIQQIGFGLYSELLERAVSALKQGKVPNFDLNGADETEVNLHAPALIPDDYLPDVHARLTLYKRIASAKTAEDLRDIKIEMIDRFGLLPTPVKQLFSVTELKLAATPLGIDKLEIGPYGGRIVFKPDAHINAGELIRLIQTQPQTYRLKGQEKLYIDRECEAVDLRRQMARELLGALTPAAHDMTRAS